MESHQIYSIAFMAIALFEVTALPVFFRRQYTDPKQYRIVVGAACLSGLLFAFLAVAVWYRVI